MTLPHEYEEKIDKMESRIYELEQEVEDRETKLAMMGGLAFALMAQLGWHNWMLSLGIGISTAFLYWKFEATKPFATGVRKEHEEMEKEEE